MTVLVQMHSLPKVFRFSPSLVAISAPKIFRIFTPAGGNPSGGGESGSPDPFFIQYPAPLPQREFSHEEMVAIQRSPRHPIGFPFSHSRGGDAWSTLEAPRPWQCPIPTPGLSRSPNLLRWGRGGAGRGLVWGTPSLRKPD